jgi:hypothetical protein
MVRLMFLWIPIVLSAVFVFVASSIIHMVLRYHQNDFRKLPKEDEILDALRPFNPPPGDYMAPRAGSMEAMKAPEFVEKLKRGPVFMMTIFPNRSFSMGPALFQWFLYCLLVSVFAAYVAGRALPGGAHYLAVFRFAGVTAFAGYSLALMQGSIWYRRNWGVTLTLMFDGLVYALLTAGTFGWLWPR